MVGAVLSRLRQAAAEILSQPALYWAIAGVFWLRVIVLSAVVPRRLDAEGMWEGGRAYLTNPSHLYDAAAAYLAQTHVIAPPGVLAAFVSPPPVALLAVPVALLPQNVGVEVWTAVDAIAGVIECALLVDCRRAIRVAARSTRARLRHGRDDGCAVVHRVRPRVDRRRSRCRPACRAATGCPRVPG